jgi:serine protease DegS
LIEQFSIALIVESITFSVKSNNPLAFVVRSIVLGIVISAVLLTFIPALRYGESFSLNWFAADPQTPERLSFSAAINRAGPAVVNIYTRATGTRRTALFRRERVERVGLGSGVIMTEQGHILTGHHVIDNADEIIVSLQDGRNLEAQLIGYDIHTDLAVLKVNADNLPVIPQMESIQPRVGDLVMAIGNPLNLGQTITQGIISATERTGTGNSNGLRQYAQFIQTDAVMNEGSSGGALIDSNGNLVGINHANFKSLDANNRVVDVAGVFFAVPYDLAKSIMDQLISDGTVTRGLLGIVGDELVNRSTTEFLGIRVSAMDPQGAAARGGMQILDVIIELNGESVQSSQKMLEKIAETEPGTILDFVILRNGQTIALPIQISALTS